MVSHTCRRLLRPRVTDLLIVFQSSLSIEHHASVSDLSCWLGSGLLYCQWNNWVRNIISFVSEDSIRRRDINYGCVYLTPPVLPTWTTQRHRNPLQQLNSLSHPHHQWTLSLISSTSSWVPLMMRVYPRMKRGVAQGLTHLCVLLHEMSHSSLHIWRLLRLFKYHGTFSFMLGSKCLAYVLNFSQKRPQCRQNYYYRCTITYTASGIVISTKELEHYYLSITFK